MDRMLRQKAASRSHGRSCLSKQEMIREKSGRSYYANFVMSTAAY